MKTKNPTIQPESHQDALTSFTEELARIQTEKAHYTSQIAQHQAELATIAERARQREAQETAAKEALDTIKNAYSEAQLRSELLTSGELAAAAQKELSALEKQFRTVQSTQMKRLSEIQDEANTDRPKTFQAQEDIDRAHQAIERLNERQQIAESLHQKATFTEAEAALHSHLNTVKAMQTQMAQQQAILVRMQEEQENYIRRASGELSNFPEQQKAFQATLLYSDQLTRILEGELAFIDLVLVEGPGVTLPHEVKRKLNMTYLDMSQLLSFDHPAWWPALSVRGGAEPELLLEKKDQITRILATHREMQTN